MFMVLVHKSKSFTITWKNSVILKKSISMKILSKFLKTKHSEVNLFV